MAKRPSKPKQKSLAETSSKTQGQWMPPGFNLKSFERDFPSIEEREGDPRIGNLIGKALQKNLAPKIAIVGFPSDQGVTRNGGRAGASEGPAAIRKALYKLTPDPEHLSKFSELLGQTIDLGDLKLGAELERNQVLLGLLITTLLREGVTPIILGGGHETSFGHFLGYVGFNAPVSILNWDAHPDVRPLMNGMAHSGSPFRQAVQHKSGLCKKYSAYGLLQHSSAKAHLNYIEEHGGRYLFLDRIDLGTIENAYARMNENHFVSFDLDLVDGSISPGVSAPSIAGMQLSHWLMAAERAGATRWVQSIDIVECNPKVEPSDQTARVAALTIWRFLRGFLIRL